MLSDPRSLRYFEPFLARTVSVSQAAEEAGCELDTMYYRVRRFVAAGLLRVAELRRRAGRPMKLYRSVADEFVVPFEATPYAELEERIREQRREHEDLIVGTMARLLRDSGWDARRLYRTDDGEVNMESAGPAQVRVDWSNLETLVLPQRTPAENLSVELELTDAEARTLLLSLYRLVLAKPRRHGSSGTALSCAPADGVARTPYLVQFTIVPLRDTGA